MTLSPPGKAALFWLGLTIASVLLTALLTFAALPASFLIGPMVAAIAFGIAGSESRVPRRAFLIAQGIVGCLISSTVTPELVAEMARDWHAMLLGAAITIGSSAAIGLFLARFGTLPGSTAAWGTSPGVASGMVVMAQEYGADPRLVATMQYVRVITVVITASVVARFLIETPMAPITPIQASVRDTLLGVGASVVLVGIGILVNERIRIPAGGLIVPLTLAALINASGYLTVAAPRPAVIVAYALIGWTVGLQFERGSLIRAIRALPEMIGSAFAIIVLCALGAWLLVRFMGFSPLTAYLATTPGGIDVVAILALSGGADTPFVMAQHVVRLLSVIALGPPIARFIARRARPD